MKKHTKEQRSYNMSRIRSKSTKPEVAFRKYLWRNGIRGYRLHSKVKGKPDLFFGKQRVAVFIDGCFWHKCPVDFIAPKSNIDYWLPKIEKNCQRDASINQSLSELNITVVRFWEHEIIKNINECYRKLLPLLDP